MSYQSRVVLGGIAVVLGFDLVASLAARRLGFPYARATLGSWLIYLAVGFAAVRGASGVPLRAAALAGAAAGLADASLGWAVSWWVGPGRLPASVPLTVGRWLGTAVFVAGLAAGLATAGGVVGRRPPGVGAPAA